MSDKQLTLRLLESMDDNVNIEDILYTIYTQYKINKGLADIENNNTKTSEEIKEIINKW